MAAILVQASCAEIPTAPIQEVVLHGSVLTPDGEPVWNAVVQFFARQGDYEPRYEARVGSNGAFSIPVALGTYDIRIVPPVMAGVPYQYVRRIQIDASSRFDFRYSGKRVDIDLTDPQGAPAPITQINIFSSYPVQGDFVHLEGQIFNGHARIFLPTGTYDWSLYPPAMSGLPRRHFEDFALVSDTTLAVALSGHRITGVATRPEGGPMNGASIFYSASQSGAGTFTGPDGSYELYVPDGVYHTEAFPSEDDDEDVQARSFGYFAATGDAVRDLPFTGAWWQGTVSSTEGAPVPNAYVYVENIEERSLARYVAVRTDVAGSYRVSVVAPGWHRIRVSATGYMSKSIVGVPAGADSTIDLVLDPPSTIAPQPALSPTAALPLRQPFRRGQVR